MARRKANPKIVERKLGKEQAWGQAFYQPDRRKSHLIEIDPRLSAKRQLEVTCHEALHIAMPETHEYEIDRLGKALSKVLWLANYRKVVLHTKHTTPVKISPKSKKKNK